MSIPFSWLFNTRRTKKIWLVTTIYLGLYAVLSLCGRYQDNMTSMESVGVYCMCTSDIDEWQPPFIIVTHWPAGPGQVRHMSASITGYLFLPLAWLDQKFWHPTKDVVWNIQH